MTTATPTSSGGTVTSWSISPSLPTGLSFSTSTGAISGTPTVTSTSTTYTVTASNTGGSATATITIVVNDAAPSAVAYSGSPFTLTKGVAMTTATPSSSGGAVVSWAVSPSLPAGLSLDSSTGAISGTPTAITSVANYTVTATNAGGSNSTTVSIVVNDVAPSSITYSPSSLSLTKDVTMSAVTPTSSGGTVVSWSISPTLPAGLSFSTTSGAISGTPTTITSSTSYTVTASNTGGSATAIVTIQVNVAAPSSISYSPSSLTLAKGVSMTTVTPTSRWRAGHFVVDHTNAPSGPELQHHNRRYRWNPDSRLLFHLLHCHSQQRWRKRYSHRHHRGQRHRPIVGCLQSEYAFVDEGHDHDNGHANLKRWYRHVLVDFWNAACRPHLLDLNRCHFGYADIDHFCHNLHRNSEQHWRQCNDDGDHLGQRRRPSYRLQPKFAHTHEGLSYVNGIAVIYRWNGHLLVDFPSTSNWTHVQQHERCHLRYTNGRVFLQQLHGNGNQSRW